LPPVLLTPVANLPPVWFIPVAICHVVDNGGKFAIGINDTSAVPVAKFAAGVVDTGGTGGKFATGVVDTAGAP